MCQVRARIISAMNSDLGRGREGFMTVVFGHRQQEGFR